LGPSWGPERAKMGPRRNQREPNCVKMEPRWAIELRKLAIVGYRAKITGQIGTPGFMLVSVDTWT
jgi:hypothetical protein